MSQLEPCSRLGRSSSRDPGAMILCPTRSGAPPGTEARVAVGSSCISRQCDDRRGRARPARNARYVGRDVRDYYEELWERLPEDLTVPDLELRSAFARDRVAAGDRVLD